MFVIPRYIKGRIKHEQVREYVKAYNSAMYSKYTTLKQRTTQNQKEYQKYKEDENKDTKGKIAMISKGNCCVLMHPV